MDSPLVDGNFAYVFADDGDRAHIVNRRTYYTNCGRITRHTVIATSMRVCLRCLVVEHREIATALEERIAAGER